MFELEECSLGYGFSYGWYLCLDVGVIWVVLSVGGAWLVCLVWWWLYWL